MVPVKPLTLRVRDTEEENAMATGVGVSSSFSSGSWMVNMRTLSLLV